MIDEWAFFNFVELVSLQPACTWSSMASFSFPSPMIIGPLIGITLVLVNAQELPNLGMDTTVV
jgi:hypothetical protein